MPRRRGLTFRKYSGVSLKKLLQSRIWLQDEYVTCDPTLLHIANEFKNRFVQEQLSKLTLSQVEKFYLDGAWNVLLNKYDVDASFKKLQKGEPSYQTGKLKCFYLDNSETILTTIKNKIATVLDETEIENSMEDLLLNHVWFNLNRQHKSPIFSAATAFVHSFKDTQLKLLNEQEMPQLCAHSIWNALMYQAMSYVIKSKIRGKIKCTEEVVEVDGQYEMESMEINQLADKQITSDKEETPQDITLGSDEMIREATTIPQGYLRCKSPSKLFSRQRSKPKLLKKVNRELFVKIPFPSDLPPPTGKKILSIRTILKVQRLSKSEVELSWRSSKKYVNRIITYEIFMLQGLKFNLDLSRWSKFNLDKIKILPTTLVIRGLNSGSRYYFTVRSIIDDGKVTPISDVKFIDL